jgi:hypothetical protein
MQQGTMLWRNLVLYFLWKLYVVQNLIKSQFHLSDYEETVWRVKAQISGHSIIFLIFM